MLFPILLVQTNMKWRFVSYSSHSTTIKAIYPLVVLREMPFSNEIDTKNVYRLGGFLCVPYDIWFFFHLFHRKRLLTIASYYLSIVLSITTKHNFIPFFLWSPDWKMLQNVVCRTGHSLTESPFIKLSLIAGLFKFQAIFYGWPNINTVQSVCIRQLVNPSIDIIPDSGYN